MHSAISIASRAPAAAVFALASDVSRWNELLPHYRRAKVMSRDGERVVAEFVAVRRVAGVPIPVTWRAICWRDAADPGDLRLHFRHIRGVTRGMEVTWHIRPTVVAAQADSRAVEGCEVTIEHSFRRPLPGVDPDLVPRFVDRVFTVPIATRTLRHFAVLAEQAAARSGRSRRHERAVAEDRSGAAEPSGPFMANSDT